MVSDSATGGWLDERRRYRRLSFGMLAAGLVGFVVANWIGFPITGVGVYWFGFVGFFVVRRWAPMELFDERDCAHERQASYDTLRLAGLALVALAPAAATLDEVGYYEIPPAVQGAIWSYAGLFIVFGTAYLGRRYWP